MQSYFPKGSRRLVVNSLLVEDRQFECSKCLRRYRSSVGYNDITQNGDICNSNNIPLAEQSKEVLLDMALWPKSIIEKNSKFVIESISETVPDEIFDTNSFNESVLNNDGSANDFPPNLNKPKQMWPTKAALKQYKAAERPQKQYHQYDDEKFENGML